MRLFGVLHPAAATNPAADFAVVYCAPLFEEKLWSHRVMVNLARSLAGHGIPVLRFDYAGDGESEGEFRTASVESRMQDIQDAASHACERFAVPRVALLGLGLGGTIAAAASRTIENLAGLALWAPVAIGERLISDMLRMHLTAQMVVHRKVLHDRESLVRQIMAGKEVNVEGYDIARPLYEQLQGLLLADALAATSARALVVQVAPADRTEGQYAFLEQATRPGIEFRRVRELKFWSQQKLVFPPCQELFDLTRDWLRAL